LRPRGIDGDEGCVLAPVPALAGTRPVPVADHRLSRRAELDGEGARQRGVDAAEPAVRTEADAGAVSRVDRGAQAPVAGEAVEARPRSSAPCSGRVVARPAPSGVSRMPQSCRAEARGMSR